MANSSGRRASSAAGKRGGKKSSGSGRKGKAPTYDYEKENELFHEIGLIIFFILMVILFLCNFGIIGPAGDLVSGVLFGLFGLTSYAVPVLLFVAVSFWYANSGNPNALRKLIAGAVLFLMVGVVCELFAQNSLSLEKYDMARIYDTARGDRTGGGVIGGSLAYLLHHYLETIGTVLVVLLCGAISFILMTEKSLISGMKNGGFRMLERTREDSQRRREYARARREEQEEEYLSRREQRQEADRLRREDQEQARARREEERRQRAMEKESGRAQRREEKETEKILRMDRKVSGVILDTAITRGSEERRRDDIHEIMWNEDGEEYIPSGEEGVMPELPEEEKPLGSVFDFDNIRIRSAHQLTIDEAEEEPEQFYSTLEPDPVAPVNPFNSPIRQEDSSETENPPRAEELHEAGGPVQAGETFEGQDIRVHREDVEEPSGQRVRPAARLEESSSREGRTQQTQDMGAVQGAVIPRKYMFPPVSLLQKGKGGNKDTTQELKQTAMRLQQTLENFGVRFTITDISQGPIVT